MVIAMIPIIILVVIIITLIIYTMSINKRIQEFSNISEKVNGIKILQSFMDTIGEYSSVDEKIKKINEIILEKFNILKYSTIVVFDGAQYILKATNVDEKHWDMLINLYSEETFKDSISTATPKYITVNNDSERLPYQKMEFGRAKSAMFFPLFIDNVYIGYWLIESGQPHAFDDVDTNLIEIIRDNIITILKTIEYQKTIENIVRTDLFTQLKSAEYLYGEGKKLIDRYTISTVCMLRIINIEQINEKNGRNVGNDLIKEVSRVVKENISSEYIFVRYMGPKFVIVFSGVEPNDVVSFLNDMKIKIEKTELSDNKDTNNIVKPKLNFVITTYYKGTSIDGVTKKLEEYIDKSDKNESDINYI